MPARLKLGPGQQLVGLAGAADHGRHDAARPGLQRPHHAGVIGRGQADEAVEAGAACRPRCLFELRDGEAGVFLVEPDRVEAARPGDHLDQLRRTELAEGEDADQARLVGEQGLQVSSHGSGFLTAADFREYFARRSGAGQAGGVPGSVARA